MKRIMLFFLISVVCFGIFSFASASKPDIIWHPDERGGSFIVGSETKSIPMIDNMYAATGATIQSDFHAKVYEKLFSPPIKPRNYTVFQLKPMEVVLYSHVSGSGFSIN